jgi:hypothetical protein
MRVDEFFDNKYLAAADLNGHEVKVTISAVDVAKFDNGNKPVLMFAGKKKGMTLNKTNAGKLKAQWGSEMNDWIGKEVILFPDTTEFQGRTVDCLRLRPVLPIVNATATEPNDDIPW